MIILLLLIPHLFEKKVPIEIWVVYSLLVLLSAFVKAVERKSDKEWQKNVLELLKR